MFASWDKSADGPQEEKPPLQGKEIATSYRVLSKAKSRINPDHPLAHIAAIARHLAKKLPPHLGNVPRVYQGSRLPSLEIGWMA
ncbi:hypothetical protein kam1_237 [Methylacidiphilum kamchatkense Kam1]|uniref:Uncharacterized protein n=1 Tax=Methylacidiphilum kamchatkense Kam1 TaxID=1202785 RepID=A0A516TJR1_9BACT|nr:hypothetical protein kam1_237 [Methylacidiphilum kamchatkense Kam1]